MSSSPLQLPAPETPNGVRFDPLILKISDVNGKVCSETANCDQKHHDCAFKYNPHAYEKAVAELIREGEYNDEYGDWVWSITVFDKVAQVTLPCPFNQLKCPHMKKFINRVLHHYATHCFLEGEKDEEDEKHEYHEEDEKHEYHEEDEKHEYHEEREKHDEPAPGMWACVECTFHNNVHMVRCEICGHGRY